MSISMIVRQEIGLCAVLAWRLSQAYNPAIQNDSVLNFIGDVGNLATRITEAEMEIGQVLNIVATECRPEDEDKFNKWYDEVHIPMLFKFDGMVGATRYKLLGGSGGQARYLALYEFKNQASLEAFQKSPEMAAAREEMGQTWKGGGFEIKWRAQYEPLKTWKR